MGGLGLSFAGFMAGVIRGLFFPALPADLGPDDLTLERSTFCKSFEADVDAPAEPGVVLPVGTFDLGALASGREGLTLKVFFCCANPFTLMPASTIATAKENLIIQSPAP
jgi:hypothetical protein